MSQAHSNNALTGRLVHVAAVLGVIGASLVACAHEGVSTTSATPSPVAPSGTVGYVRMEALVKAHPLYPQLAHLDEDVAALQLRSVGPQVARSGADIGKEEKALAHELDVAAERTKKILGRKQQEYAKREQAAIAAALGAAGGANAPGGGTIENGVVQQARTQARTVTAAAQHNFAAYRQQLVDQDRAAALTLQQTLGERAEREYRARADALTRKESDFALQLASDDSAERLSLRAKLSNLALDDASRADVKRQIDALDRKESDALGAMRNRDQMTLVALQRTLHERTAAELGAQVAAIGKRTVAKIDARAVQTRQQLVGQLALPAAGSGGGAAANVSPNMRAKLEALHNAYQQDFNKDASRTIAQFARTRADLTRRFQTIAGVDDAAQNSANRQIEALQRQRGDLYDQMVAQINREVKVIAQKRGIGVVVSNVVAPAGGVDLTTDAQKDIESLHE